jgi:phosphoribosylglycinamide formyltransferase-1
VTATVAVLTAGEGHLLQALIDAVRLKILDARIGLVLSDREERLGPARQAGIAARSLPYLPEPEQEQTHGEPDPELLQQIAAVRPDWVVLDGWTHRLGRAFLAHFSYRVVDVHPFLPGGSCTAEEILAAFLRGEIKQAVCRGCLVAEGGGDPVIGSAEVPIYRSDTPTMLASRLRQAEQQLLIHSLQRLMVGDEEQIEDDSEDDSEDDDEE